MVFVRRDNDGKLLRVSENPFTDMTAEESRENSDVAVWLSAQHELQERMAQLQRSDLATVRILEDLVTLLVNKNMIDYRELPESARARLDERALVRADLEALQDEFHFSREDLEQITS